MLTADRPTADYIAKYSEIYNNPNITVFPDPGEFRIEKRRPSDVPEKGREFPKNKMTHPNC